MSQNPYPTKPGFGLRYQRAKAALEIYGQDEFCPPYSRSFDNCFEMYDGKAVIWALMHNAVHDKNEDLAEGIRRTGKDVWPNWMEIYERRGNHAPEQQQLSFLQNLPSRNKPKSPSVS